MLFRVNTWELGGNYLYRETRTKRTFCVYYKIYYFGYSTRKIMFPGTKGGAQIGRQALVRKDTRPETEKQIQIASKQATSRRKRRN